MSKKTNAWVKHRAEMDAYNAFRDSLRGKIKETIGTQRKLMEDLEVTYPTLWRRNNDPDLWNLGQLRQLRTSLGMTKAEMIEWLRPLL